MADITNEGENNNNVTPIGKGEKRRGGKKPAATNDGQAQASGGTEQAKPAATNDGQAQASGGTEQAKPAEAQTAAPANDNPSTAATNDNSPVAKLNDAQKAEARKLVTSHEALSSASAELENAKTAQAGLYDEVDGVKTRKSGITDEQITKAEESLTNAAKKHTDANTAHNSLLKSSSAEAVKATKDFKNGLFGEYNLSKASGSGILGSAAEATKNSFSNTWKHNKWGFAGKTIGVGVGAAMMLDAFRAKTNDNQDRSWVTRVGEGAAGAALTTVSLIGGRVR